MFLAWPICPCAAKLCFLVNPWISVGCISFFKSNDAFVSGASFKKVILVIVVICAGAGENFIPITVFDKLYNLSRC